MPPPRLTLPCLLSLLAVLSFPSAADPSGPPSPEILYTSRKEFVRIAPARPLTLNAHLTQFAYEPLGLEVAAVGSETTDDTTTHFVKTIDVRTGHELHRLSMTSAPISDGGQIGFKMLGWTPSGKYLLLERTQGKEDSPGESVTDLVRWDLSADPPTVRPVIPQFTLPPGALSDDTVLRYASPHNRWVLFTRDYNLNRQRQSAYQLYDTERNTFQPLVPPANTEIYNSWLDDGHLSVQSGQGRKALDVVTGKFSLLPTTSLADLPPASKQYPDLTLNVEDRPQVDQTRVSQFPSCIVWVYCPPRLKKPLSAVGAGITMGGEDPQAVWSPTGRQIAFLNHGDLYVNDVTTIPATGRMPNEKMALGLPLSCPEEQAIATSNMKQIGLAVTQYCQDYDEKFPPAGDVDEPLMPYLRNRSLYSVGNVHWVYHAPEKPELAAMEEPAATVIGTMDLPCGQVVLFGDGHVKVLEKE
jgi:hypothetical protein